TVEKKTHKKSFDIMEEPLPNAWNVENKSPFLSIDSDRLGVKYIGKAQLFIFDDLSN
ncbi:4909_t:CDS:1, partial [Dentiscutata erythropus]